MDLAAEKILSANDIGKTGTHQAGILVPKRDEILRIFPSLDPTARNPRKSVRAVDEAGWEWSFEFIYYNNSRFGGTRDEYRLTRMTDFLRRHQLKPGDRLIFNRTSGLLSIEVRRRSGSGRLEEHRRLKLRGSWRIIRSDV